MIYIYIYIVCNKIQFNDNLQNTNFVYNMLNITSFKKTTCTKRGSNKNKNVMLLLKIAMN